MMAMSGSARQMPEKTVRSPVKTLGTVRQGGKCVFEDLKLPDAQELNVKAQMAYRVCELIQKHKLTQQEAASILGTDQPRYVSPRFQAAQTLVGVAGRRRTCCYFRCYFRPGRGLVRPGRGPGHEKTAISRGFFKVVPAEGLEPPHPSGQQILSLSRLPFRHAGMVVRPKI